MVKVLNEGYLELVEWMGGDAAVARNARRCYRSESQQGGEADRRLLRRLLRARHLTPFEASVFTFDVKCPIFVARQWIRHRIASYNEESLRYCVAERSEQARAVLPLGTYTKFYWTVNANSLMNFLRLRLDKAAQWEIRQYGLTLLELVEEIMPVTFGIFRSQLESPGDDGPD